MMLQKRKFIPNTRSLYVHIPFCAKKCFFCSFAIAVDHGKYQDEYLRAIYREAGRYREKISTVYIGGGTPSLLTEECFADLGQILKRNFSFIGGCEYTIEANPESVSAEKASLWRAMGVTRVSLGVQSTIEERLAYLGRSHRHEDSLRAFRLLRDAGFDNINVDLMYGFPGQTEKELLVDIEGILSWEPEHVSVYALTVEERSLFFARKETSAESSSPDLYSFLCRRMNDAGIRQYEISNFSREGFQSEHNLNYWHGGEYVGLGMAAHSHLDGRRFWNADTLPRYFELMRDRGDACAGSEILEAQEKIMETFLFGLRMNEGVDMEALEERYAIAFSDGLREKVEHFIETGFLEEVGRMVRATDKGRVVLDELSVRLI